MGAGWGQRVEQKLTYQDRRMMSVAVTLFQFSTICRVLRTLVRGDDEAVTGSWDNCRPLPSSILEGRSLRRCTFSQVHVCGRVLFAI